MPSPFHGIDLASTALRSMQRALDTTGHNIANVNTRGFSRQVVDFSPTSPMYFYSNGRQALGTGVTITSVNRVRDLFLDQRMRDSNSELGRFGTLRANLSAIEGIYNEPSDDGIQAALDGFFDAWSAFGSNPSEHANRMQVRLAGERLSGRIQTASEQLQTAHDQAGVEIGATIRRINELGATIHDLNTEIRHARAMGGEPNDMLDKLGVALEELSGLTNAEVRYSDDGTAIVSISQFLLVGPADHFTLPSTYDAETQTIQAGGMNVNIRSGELAGLMQSMQRTKNEQANLDALANALVTQVNAVHRTGINAAGTTNVDFFQAAVPGPTTASEFRLSDAVIADMANIASGTSGNAGDGGLALSLSNMRSASQAALGNRTFGAYYRDVVTAVGEDAAYYELSEETQVSISGQLDAQREQISGVSLDDEMANMLRFQRSYQAAAKALTIFDQVTEDLINMVRR